VDVAKQIWDTLHLAHEGVNKVRKARIDLMMHMLNRFVILDGEGPQEIFDRLMTMVGKIRGYGCDELDDHKVVKIMLEAYSLRNETVVTLIRDKKKFEYFTPNDVLERILTFDMQREEVNERKKLGELQAKLEGIKINKDVALKANKSSKQGSNSKSKTNKQASISKPKATKQVQERVKTTSSSSESENDDEQYEKVDDVALFMKMFHKGLGYKVVKRKFSNKKKRTCYNYGSTGHFIAKCPYEIKDNKYKKEKKEDKADRRKSKKNMGEAHIGHEWDSTIESSSEEDEKVATVAIHKPSSPPRLFTNMSDDDYYSPHIYLMEKGEKIKSKSKAKAPPPPPPSDISSSDISDSSSDEEIDQLTKNLDGKTKLFITKLMEDLESVQAELESREKTLIQQVDLYIASKKALALERSEVESLHKALAKEQWDHAITKKENITLKKKVL
jgi:hypothetical protein